MRLLEERIGEDIDYQSISGAIGLSLHRFHHLFAEEAGETPGSYVRRVRLDAAAMRLRWTRETAGLIAQSLGYESQSAFNSAFERRFGVSPGRFRKEHARRPSVPVDEIDHRRITIRESKGFYGIAKRYVGQGSEVRRHWADFLASLPPGLRSDGRQLYLGLIHHAPQTAPPDQSRYDCCLTLSEDAEGLDWLPSGGGFHKLVTRAGFYACVEQDDDASSSPAPIDLFLGSWLANSGYILTDDPKMELYAMPPSRSPEARRRSTLLLAVTLRLTAKYLMQSSRPWSK